MGFLEARQDLLRSGKDFFKIGQDFFRVGLWDWFLFKVWLRRIQKTFDLECVFGAVEA